MKYLYHKLLVILFLPISIYASDVYYCGEDDATGFTPRENYAVTRFEGNKYKIMIDFEQNMIQSKDLYFDSHTDPKCIVHLDNLNCINALGIAFIINKTTLKFYKSAMFNPGRSTDSVVIAHGSCEKF